jgi:hypothetical protein
LRARNMSAFHRPFFIERLHLTGGKGTGRFGTKQFETRT